jgi:hypothetical protein
VAKLKRKSLSRDKRAVSAVIATVIIVAVTIAVAIAVAYWMGGLAAIFTRFEKIEISTSYVTIASNTYKVTITYENTGATATTIDMIQLNGVPTASFSTPPTLLGDFAKSPIPAEIGVVHSGTIQFQKGLTDPSGNALSSGVTLTVNLHSSSGKDYYTSMTLP